MAAKVGPNEWRCPGPCEEIKGWDDFYHPETKRTKISHYCKDCAREKQAENRALTSGRY
jgi:hypothetical protein